MRNCTCPVLVLFVAVTLAPGCGDSVEPTEGESTLVESDCGNGVDDDDDELTDCEDPDCSQASCDDGNACTDDICVGGICAGIANITNSCDDGNACTIDACSNAGTCVGTPPSSEVCDNELDDDCDSLVDDADPDCVGFCPAVAGSDAQLVGDACDAEEAIGESGDCLDSMFCDLDTCSCACDPTAAEGTMTGDACGPLNGCGGGTTCDTTTCTCVCLEVVGSGSALAGDPCDDDSDCASGVCDILSCTCQAP